MVPADVHEQTGAAGVDQPLLFRNHHSQRDRDPQALAERLALSHPVLDLAPRRGHTTGFVHRTNTIQAGSLLLTSGYCSPIEGAMGGERGNAYVNFCLAGSIRYRTQGLHQSIDPLRPLWFSPGASYRYSTDHLHALVMRLDLERLKTTAGAIAGLGVAEQRFANNLDVARVLGREDPRSQRLIQLFRQTLQMLDTIELDPLGHLDVLQVDDLIYRIFALLLHPRLDDVLPGQGLHSTMGPRQRIFEELLEWIHANLHAPISLTTLEQRSGYSRRTLQLAFQQRFGCGPVQWVRQQRLEQSRQALLRPQSGDSVSAIASRFGFSNPATFSRSFMAAFGIRPSELLHDGQRRLT